MKQPLTIFVNGVEQPANAPPESSLLGFLREQLGLTGAKVGCGAGDCGVCTVLIDGAPARACVTSIGETVGRHVVTIEGLARDGRLHPLQQAFLDADAFQCGYCTPGMILTGAALLARNPDPDNEAIVAAMNSNLCRCGMYTRIMRAIRQAGAAMQTQTTGGRDD